MSALPELRGRSGRVKIFLKDPQRIFQEPERLPLHLVDRIRHPSFLERAETYLQICQEHGWTHICFTSSAYPEVFRHLQHPPIVLWIEGNPNLPEPPRLALVGSRHSTSYGANALRTVCEEIVSTQVAIISGLAYGIDTRAHEFALEHNLRTIAFLGHGLFHMYPASNKELRQKIVAAGGSIVSEFPPDVPPRAPHFPIRNRLISAFSEVVCIIEAPLKSGALNTAHWALEQGKEVCAIPGSIFRETSRGTNFLISRGYARAVTTSRELLDMFPEWCKPVLPRQKSRPHREPSSRTEKWLLNLLDFETPLSIEILLKDGRERGIPLHKLYHALFSLEKQGFVLSLPGKRYLRKR